MGNKLKLTLLLLMSLSISPVLSFAGLIGSKHDMLVQEKGISSDICGYCHIPHNAAGDKIWSLWGNEAQLTSGPSTTIGNMCYTCHDGTVTNLGQGTAFNSALQQHKIGADTDCNICHTAHDNTNGKFLGIQKTQSAATEAATYCETCHDTTMYPGAEPHGDHLAGSEHPYKDTGALLNQSCNSCHQMHGAANYITLSLTNPILKLDNTDSVYCATCHPMYKAEVSSFKHPSLPSNAGTWGKVGCEACHDPHQPNDSGRTAILKGVNHDSQMCINCHNGTGGPAIGHSHALNVSLDYIYGGGVVDPEKTPGSDAIDDDGIGGIDYPGNSVNILICETCHSTHRKGLEVKALRMSIYNDELCYNCHLPSSEDCSDCHGQQF